MEKSEHRLTAGDIEHIAAFLSGATLVAFGLSRKSAPGLALAALGGGLMYRGLNGYKRVYDLLGIEPHKLSELGRSVLVEKKAFINVPPERLYDFWKNLENLPKFMRHLVAVEDLGNGRSHWVAKGPAGSVVEWEAEITRDIPNEMIGWRSVEGSDVDNAGSVRFLPGRSSDGTEVRVTLRYNPPGDILGAVAARLFGRDPGTEIEQDLKHLKALLESS